LVVDRRFIARLLDELGEQVRLLEAAQARGPEILRDPLTRNGLYYTVQCAIEAVITTANHLIAECAFQAPERPVDAVATLAREGILTEPDLAQSLPAMVRFRNLLVHRYWSVDADRVWLVVTENLADFRRFAAAIERFLAANPDL